MAQPPGPPSSAGYVEDLDVLTGSPRDFKLNGRELRIYAVFSNNNVAHWRKIADRRQRNLMRYLAEMVALKAWQDAVQESNQGGTPPPLPPDMEALREKHPDYYPADEYERDVYNLLLSVWQKSEASKPEHEREPVTPESVRDLTDKQALAILDRLFPLRNGLRVPAPETTEEPASEPEAPTEDATSTASTTKARSPRGKGTGRRKATSRSSAS